MEETDIYEKITSSQTEEDDILRKQIGCMNGIFQLFDRQDFLTSRRMKNRHNQKRLLRGVQYHLDSQYTQKGLMEKNLSRQKENPRIPSEMPRTSYSSSCSSTLSSLDYNRSTQQEAVRDTNINTERPSQIRDRREQPPPLAKGTPFLDHQDAMKVSKSGNVRGLSVKSMAYDEMRSKSIKHIDSPRPALSFQPVKPKPIGYERSDRVSVKVQENRKISKDERVLPPRFSYDELREKTKSNTVHKELPRLSLDSKVSSLKCSGIPSKFDFLGHNLHVGHNKNLDHDHDDSVPGTHTRSSSIVTKLMGLDVFPDATVPVDISTPTVKSCCKEAFLSQFASTTKKSKVNQVTSSPRVSQNDPVTPSRQLRDANSHKKSTSSMFPVERTPRGQQDPTQGTQKLALQTKNAQANFLDQPSSVYGEIEKRITQLEFRKSGKNLRALKQILEAMHKTREGMEKQGGIESTPQTSSSEESCSDQNSNTSAWNNRESYLTKQSGSSKTTMKATRATDNVKSSISTRIPTSEMLHLQRIGTWAPKSHKVSGSLNIASKDNNRDCEDPPSKPKQRISESERTLAMMQLVKEAKHTTSCSGTLGPRLRLNKLQRDERSRIPLSDSPLAKKHSHKKLIAASHLNRKQKLKPKASQLKDDGLSEISSETKYSGYQGDTTSAKLESSNRIVPQAESDIISSDSSSNLRVKQIGDSESPGEHKRSAKIWMATHDQPSPVSVLDDSFYNEDSPSPVKKTSNSFRDESQSSGEAKWHYRDISSLTNCARSDSGYFCNQMLGLKHSGIQQRHSDTEPGSQKEPAYETINPDHRYVNKILAALGVVTEPSFIPTIDHVLSSCHLINPEMFHVLEQTEDISEVPSRHIQERTSRTMLKDKVHRKIIFDMVNEILVRRIYSGKLHTVGKRITGIQGLLKEVHLEIDHICRRPEENCTDNKYETTRLFAEDMMRKSKDWENFNGEIPVLILDIERLIFKDLINETVIGEILALPDRPKKNCRQLFSIN